MVMGASAGGHCMVRTKRRGKSTAMIGSGSIFLLMTFILQIMTYMTHAFSSISTNSNTALLSRLQTIQAEILVSVGRVPGTAMPPEWAASGAKLGFALEVEFTDEQCDYEMTKERLLKGDALMGSKLLMVEPLNDPSFVSANGKEDIEVLPGAYGCQIQGLGSNNYAFRFFLDFPKGAKRNDVELPAERIYFLSSCWLDDGVVLERARRRKETITKSIQEITDEMEKLEQDSSGFFQKAVAFRQSIDLFERKAKLRAQLEDLEQQYPLDSSKIIRGPNDIIFSKEGVIAVKRLRGTMGTREQYHWVGKFTYNDFFEDEDKDEE